MLVFKNLTIENRAEIQPMLLQSSYPLSNFSFANQVIWAETFHPKFTIIDDMLISLFRIKKESYFHFPIGKGDVKSALDEMMKYAKKMNTPCCIAALTEDMKLFLETNFPNQFTFTTSRNFYDYLHKTKDLIELKGKQYQSKRNHINKFKKMYSYVYAPITYRDIDDCLETHEQWIDEQDCGGKRCTFEQETCAVKIALNLFDKIGMQGGLMRVDGKVIAFTLGQAISDTVYDICIEKALSEYEGAYAIINQQFLEHQVADYLFVNREEDLGIEGLRKAKLSYHPYQLIPKYSARSQL